MTTVTRAPVSTTPAARRPMGALLAVVSLMPGPALIALTTAALPSIWHGSTPDYHVIERDQLLAMLSFNLAATSFPFMFTSVMALAVAARSTRRLAGAGLGCAVMGLSVMFANAILSVPLAFMDDGPGTPASRLGNSPLGPPYLFPLYLAGAILAAIALWRSRAVPPWASLAIGAGGLLPPTIATGIGALTLPIAALRIAGSIPLARALLAGRA